MRFQLSLFLVLLVKSVVSQSVSINTFDGDLPLASNNHIYVTGRGEEENEIIISKYDLNLNEVTRRSVFFNRKFEKVLLVDSNSYLALHIVEKTKRKDPNLVVKNNTYLFTYDLVPYKEVLNQQLSSSKKYLFSLDKEYVKEGTVTKYIYNPDNLLILPELNTWAPLEGKNNTIVYLANSSDFSHNDSLQSNSNYLFIGRPKYGLTEYYLMCRKRFFSGRFSSIQVDHKVLLPTSDILAEMRLIYYDSTKVYFAATTSTNGQIEGWLYGVDLTSKELLFKKNLKSFSRSRLQFTEFHYDAIKNNIVLAGNYLLTDTAQNIGILWSESMKNSGSIIITVNAQTGNIKNTLKFNFEFLQCGLNIEERISYFLNTYFIIHSDANGYRVLLQNQPNISPNLIYNYGYSLIDLNSELEIQKFWNLHINRKEGVIRYELRDTTYYVNDSISSKDSAYCASFIDLNVVSKDNEVRKFEKERMESIRLYIQNGFYSLNNNLFINRSITKMYFNKSRVTYSGDDFTLQSNVFTHEVFVLKDYKDFLILLMYDEQNRVLKLVRENF